MPLYPSPSTWKHASTRQKDRAERSFAKLRRRHVPVYGGPLLVDDDEEVTAQSPQDIARRTLVLWAVALKADGTQPGEAREIIENFDLWKYVSPNEKPSPEENQDLVWRFECLWVLMWSLGYIDDLNWPNEMCDVDKLTKLLIEHEGDPTFISAAKLSSTRELLDAQDLTMRIHWAIRNVYLQQGGMIPEELDWSGGPEYVPVTLSAAALVVQERHHVLNWLVNFLGPESWDDVDTST